MFQTFTFFSFDSFPKNNVKVKKVMKKFGQMCNVDIKGLKFVNDGNVLSGKELVGDLEEGEMQT